VRAKRSDGQPKQVDFDVTAQALAKAVYEGDVVNFRMLFSPFSPAREDSPERFDTPKYAYLLPDGEMVEQRQYQQCLFAVNDIETKAHTRKELEANRPAQLPSDLILLLADNAVRRGKYTSAAEAYEMLRIRARMQQEFFAQADAALDANEMPKAVRGYLIATGLAFDYAAFPEPLPAVPNFQTRALMLHAEYPDVPEKCVAMRESESLMQTALAYLLLDAAAAARLEDKPLETRLAFLVELVKRRDPQWAKFVERYRLACATWQEFSDQLERAKTESTLVEDIENLLAEDAYRIPAQLLGRAIESGEWWQYLKEMAYEHPPSVLFVARQVVGQEEILAPRYRPDSPIGKALGLLPDSPEGA